MNKRFIFFFILFSFFIPFVHVSAEESALADLSIRYTNEETNFVAVIEDNADLLTEEEENMLLNQMISLTEYGHIIFLSINDNPTTTKNYISDYYHDHFNTDSGSIFLIDMDNRQIYLFSDGNNFNIVREDKAYSITDNVYRYAKKRDYYSCVNEAFIQVEKLLTGHKIAEPMRLASNIVISLIISFLLSFLYVLSQTKIRRVPEKSLRKNYNVQLTTGKITKEKTGESKEYSPRSDYDSWGGSSGGGFSGGGGGGGGFSGGGGSSSGGGGGHSF